MKKSKIIFLSIMSVLILSGCGTPKIDKTLENMKNLNSYTMKVENKQNNIISNSKIEFDGNNNIVKQTSNMDLNGTTTETIMYTQIDNNKLTTYTKGLFGDNWIINEVEGEFNDNNEIAKITSMDTSKFTKVKSSSKDIFKYEVDLKETENIDDIKYYVYTDGKYITKIEMTSESANLNQVIIFSNINNTNVTIPNEVKENAKKMNEINHSDVDLSKYENLDISGMVDNDTIQEQIEKAKEYMNSEEYQNKINEVQEYINSNEFENQMNQLQEYMNSDEYQRQIQEAQERARALLGN